MPAAPQMAQIATWRGSQIVRWPMRQLVGSISWRCASRGGIGAVWALPAATDATSTKTDSRRTISPPCAWRLAAGNLSALVNVCSPVPARRCGCNEAGSRGESQPGRPRSLRPRPRLATTAMR